MSQHYPAYLYTTPVNPPQFNPAAYYPQFPHISPQAQHLSRPASPDPAPVSPDVASQTVQRLISAELKQVGFESATSAAVQRLENEVVAFVQHLYERAHEYANLANRAGPIITDLMRTCEDAKLSTKDLRATSVNAKKRRKKSVNPVRAPKLQPPKARLPSVERLPSDDEGTLPTIPTTLRTLTQQLPTLPPKHTYQQTPASPPKRAALPSLEKKLKTASLVQDSLENLLLRTEDSSTQKDAELLGHIVNWEMNMHPRKNWSIRQSGPSLITETFQ